jgi:hypothetical protein
MSLGGGRGGNCMMSSYLYYFSPYPYKCGEVKAQYLRVACFIFGGG